MNKEFHKFYIDSLEVFAIKKWENLNKLKKIQNEIK